VAAACTPASAKNFVFTAYKEVSETVGKAGLVATSFPTALGPVDRIELEFGPGPHGTYALDYTNRTFDARGAAHFAGYLRIGSLGRRSLAAEARSSRRNFREQSTSVRGRRALLMTGRHTGTLVLMWSEAGRLYLVQSFTPRTISVSDLRSVAASLGHVLGILQATEASRLAAGGGTANAVVSEHTLILAVRWESSCPEPGSPIPATRDDSASTTLALNGGAFSFAPAQLPPAYGHEQIEGEPATWTLSLAGSASPGAGTVTLSASGTSPRVQCTSGPVTFQLGPAP
jgi:hypothetical protein